MRGKGRGAQRRWVYEVFGTRRDSALGGYKRWVLKVLGGEQIDRVGRSRDTQPPEKAGQ